MKPLFKRYLVTISILAGILFPYNATWSCGPFLATDGTMFLLFQRQPSPLDVFYYTEHFLYKPSDAQYSDDNRNCAEWASISKGQATQKDVYNILYNVSADEFMFHYNTNSWGSLADNSFIKWLETNKPTMDYLAFAKKVEFAHMDKSPDKWGLKTPITAGFDSLIAIGLKHCASPLPDFLKQRYAFQAVKLMYYKNLYNQDSSNINNSGPYDDAALIKTYETYLKDKKSILADWAMLYYAFSIADAEKRTLYLLKTFDISDSKRITVYNSLKESDLNPLLGHQKDPKLLASIYAYKALKNPGRALPLIRQVYTYDPHSKYLQVLITREINKTEDWILSPRVLGFNSVLREAIAGDREHSGDTTYEYYAAKNLAKDVQYAHEMQQFLVGILSSKTIDKNFLKLAIVRLHHINNDFTGALPYLNSISRLADPQLELQRQIEQTVSVMYTQDIESETVQTKLYNQFIALEKADTQNRSQKEADYYNELPSQHPVNELYLLLSQRYRQKGDIVKAGLLFKKACLLVNEYFGPNSLFSFEDDSTNFYSHIGYWDKYGTPPGVDSLIRFVNKPDKSDFEKDILPKTKLNEHYLIDLKGTLLLRQGKFEEALNTISVLPDDFWAKTYAFRHHLSRSNVTSLGKLLPVATGLNKTYAYSSKKEILKDIVALRATLATEKRDSAIASLNFLLANSYFNISHYGKDWMMYSYGKSASEINPWGSWNWATYSFYPNMPRHSAVYYQCAWATESYRVALAHAGNNKELAAQCLLMLNLCEQYAFNFEDVKKSESTGIYHFADEYKPHYSSHLKQLINRYSKTIVFERAATECPDVAAYIKTLR